jgi:DNA-binding transcriptional LysR family regulator
VRFLEELCGFKLLLRKGHSVHPTEEGKIIFEYAKKVFQVEREIENTIDELRRLKKGTLRLGTARTYKRYFLPYIINFFHKSYPNIKVVLDEGSSLEMIQSLKENRNHLAIISRPVENVELRFLPLCYEDVVLIFSPGHPFSGRNSISIHELVDQSIIMKEPGSGTRRLIEDLFRRYGLKLKILMETSDAETIKKLVELNEGVSFLVRMAVKDELKKGTLASAPIKGERIVLEISVGFPGKTKPSPCADAFLALLREKFKGRIPYKSLDSFVRQLLIDSKNMRDIK